MSSGEPEIWAAGPGGGGGGARGYSAGSDYSSAYGGALPFQERILVPRPWQSAEAKNDDSDNDDDDGGKKDASGKPKSGDKRGGYKCGRCGQPKKGHVCTNKPRLKTAFVETAEAWAQAECDPEMALRTLDTKVQGFPESYGLTFRWAPAGAVPGYYPHSVGNHMQQAPAPGPAPPQQVYYMPAPGGQPAQGVMYYAATPAPGPGYAPAPPQQYAAQPQQQQPPPQHQQQQQPQQQQGGGYY